MHLSPIFQLLYRFNEHTITTDSGEHNKVHNIADSHSSSYVYSTIVLLN